MAAFKKTIVIVLIIVLVVPMTFFVKPKPADAFISCILDAIGLLAGLGSAVNKVFSVPTGDFVTETATSQNAAADTGSNLKECLLDQIAFTMANALIRNITASTVEWINSGFEGSPSFVTDPEGFFLDVGDQVAGQWIEELGPLGDLLCSPFDLQIRLSLGIGWTQSHKEEIRCRLSDVQKNVYNAFLKGGWGSDGWSNWISISRPSNNMYGVYLEADNQLTRNVLRQLNINEKELQWGKGFRSFRKCVAYRPDGSCLKHDKNLSTPGSVIETQLNNVLDSQKRRLETADEINEIMDALINQAFNKVFSSMGIGGMSVKSPRYGGSSYIKSLVTDYEKQVAESTAKPPTWVNCNYTYHIEDVAGSKKISVWMPGWMPNGTTCVAPSGTTLGPGCFTELTPSPTLTSEERAMTASTLENAIKLGCANVNNTVDKVAGQNANSAVGDITGLGFLSPELTAGGAGTYQKNYAMDGEVKLESSRPDAQPSDGGTIYLDSSFSVDGARKACNKAGLGGFAPSTRLDPESRDSVPAFLKITLPIAKPIDQISLYVPYASNSSSICDTMTRNYRITWYNESGTKMDHRDLQGSTNHLIPLKITFPSPQNIKSVEIKPLVVGGSTFELSGYLQIAEVEILGQAKVTAPGTTETVTPASSKVSMNPAALSLPNPLKLGSLFSPSDSMHYNFKLTHSESKPIPELKLKMTLKSIEGSLVTQQDLNKYFTNITIKKTVSNDCSDPYASSIVNSPPPPTTLEIPLGASAVSQYCIQISAKLPIYNTTGIDTLGAFELQTEITESAYDTTSEQFLKVGTHKASFIINKP